VNSSPLTKLQVEATRLFFTLPDSAGFAVAGGAALIARGLITRPTKDVDLFLVQAGASTVGAAAAGFEAAMSDRGWSHGRVIDQHDFVRLSITDGHEGLIIDLGRDSLATEAIGDTSLGPTLSARDLAARKTLAPFGRAEARDFADVYALARRFGRDRLIEWAAQDDAGFDRQIFARMLATIDRLAELELPVNAREAVAVRAYIHGWAAELDPSLTILRPPTAQEPEVPGREPEHG
jgi:hypothetical protein